MRLAPGPGPIMRCWWGEVPVGAVILRDGQVSATLQPPDHHARPHPRMPRSSLSHAAQLVENHRLPDCELYVTLEPCAMCSMALMHAPPRAVVFGAPDPEDRWPARWWTLRQPAAESPDRSARVRSALAARAAERRGSNSRPAPATSGRCRRRAEAGSDAPGDGCDPTYTPTGRHRTLGRRPVARRGAATMNRLCVFSPKRFHVRRLTTPWLTICKAPGGGSSGCALGQTFASLPESLTQPDARPRRSQRFAVTTTSGWRPSTAWPTTRRHGAGRARRLRPFALAGSDDWKRIRRSVEAGTRWVGWRRGS